MSVATLLAMPRAKGLFRRAIVQSGNTPKVNSAATAERIGRRLAEILGVEATGQAIAATSPERVLQAQAKLRDELLARPDPAFWGEVALSYLPWAPTVDRSDDPGSLRLSASAAGVGGGYRPAGWIEHGGNAAVLSVRRLHRPHHRRGAIGDRGRLWSVGGGLERLPRGASGRQRWRAVLGDPDRLVLAHPRCSTWPTPTRRPPVPPRTCTNSLGARRSSADASARPIR